MSTKIKYTWKMVVTFSATGISDSTIPYYGTHAELLKIENMIRACLLSLDGISFHYIGKIV